MPGMGCLELPQADARIRLRCCGKSAETRAQLAEPHAALSLQTIARDLARFELAA